MKKALYIFLFLVVHSSMYNYSESKTIYIQPLGDVNMEYINYVEKSVKEFYGYDCVIKSKLNLTNDQPLHLLFRGLSCGSPLFYSFNLEV